MKQLHWTVYLACGTAGTAAILMLIVADVANMHDLGKWAIFSALVCAVLSVVIVCDRFARRIGYANRREAARRVEAYNELMRAQTDEIVGAFNDQTQEVAEAVCTSVLRVFVDSGATPINRRS